MWKLISIEDTRSFDDSGTSIPGSGIQRPCDHCGKSHDIICEITDGKQIISVGSTCAKKLCYNTAILKPAIFITINLIKMAIAELPTLESQISELTTLDEKREVISRFISRGWAYWFVYENKTKDPLSIYIKELIK